MPIKNLISIFTIFIFSGCAFLARNHQKNQLLYLYASKHEYQHSLDHVVERVKQFSEYQRDEESRRSEPQFLIGTNGFFYNDQIYHSWRTVELEAYGLYIRKKMAPVMPYTIVLDQADKVELAGINHLYRVYINENKKISVEAYRLKARFVGDQQLPEIRKKLSGTDYAGEMTKILHLHQALTHAARDFRHEWKLLEKIDQEAVKNYVKQANVVIEKLK